MGSAVLDKLVEGNGTDALTEGVSTGGLFSTGSGRSLAISGRALRRATTLVGDEVDEASNSNRKRSKSFCACLRFDWLCIVGYLVAWNW